MAADSPRTRPAHGTLQGWPARPESWAWGAAGGADPHSGACMAHEPYPKPRAWMDRSVSDPEEVLHVLRGCDLSLKEDKMRYPAAPSPGPRLPLERLGWNPWYKFMA